MPRTSVRRGLAAVLGAAAVGLLLSPAAVAHAASPDGSDPTTEQDYAALSASVDQLETQPDPSVGDMLALVPNLAYAEQPQLADLIQGGGTAAPSAKGSATASAGSATTSASSSGASIPGCPAQGRQLYPGLPAPYGYFPPNPTNNWCTPNGPDNGCSFVPDNGLTFDFRAACRQHDLAYRWVPADRVDIDNRLFTDMSADCNRRNFASRALCYTRAGIMYAFVRAFAGFAYGNSNRPGYNAPPPPLPLEPAPTCAQSTHAWVETFGRGGTLSRGTLVYLTGVVRKQSRVRFDFYDGAGNLVADHLTYFSDNNCVVHHEPEAFDTGRLPMGTVTVNATFARWEDNVTVTEQVATLQIVAGGGSTTCLQASHAWVETFGQGSTLPQGRTVYLTGVVRRGTPIVFRFYDGARTEVASHQTQPARDNCVVHHEPEWFSTAWLPVGTISVDATYTQWETDMSVTVRVATLSITAPTGGGGGGGGGGGCGEPQPEPVRPVAQNLPPDPC